MPSPELPRGDALRTTYLSPAVRRFRTLLLAGSFAAALVPAGDASPPEAPGVTALESARATPQTFASEADAWAELDGTAEVHGDGTYPFALLGTADFSSRERIRPPAHERR